MTTPRNRPRACSLLLAAALVTASCGSAPDARPLPSSAPSAPTHSSAAPPEPSPPGDPVAPHAPPFDSHGFGDIPLGTPHDLVGPLSGMPMDGCPADGQYRFSGWPGPADDAPWVLWTSGSTTDEVTGDVLASEFGIQAGQFADMSAPFGPVGPSGLQLGWSDADVAAAFPQALSSEYLAEYFNETYTLRTVELDGAVMVVATVNGKVVDIRWGAASVAVDWVHERCGEGPAPFDWESEPGH